jgi:hypothetical protein
MGRARMTFVFRPSFRVHPRRDRRQVHILARAPILPLCAAAAKALYCPYVGFCRASMVLHDAAMQRITCREQTIAYCTYGRNGAGPSQRSQSSVAGTGEDPCGRAIPRGEIEGFRLHHP